MHRLRQCIKAGVSVSAIRLMEPFETLLNRHEGHGHQAKAALESGRAKQGIPLASRWIGTVSAFALSVWHGSVLLILALACPSSALLYAKTQGLLPRIAVPLASRRYTTARASPRARKSPAPEKRPVRLGVIWTILRQLAWRVFANTMSRPWANTCLPSVQVYMLSSSGI